MPFEPGQRLGRYRIVALVGSGGMGEVYRAHDSRLQRDVAIKLLTHGPGGRAPVSAVMAEARAASALSHAHICALHEVDSVDGHTFLVMELVEGQTLAALIRRHALSIEQVVRYGGQIASGLAHAHERGVIHRDLKSANVMVAPAGAVKILDFGIARRSESSDFAETTLASVPVEEGGFAGTLPYIAPEVTQGAPAGVSSEIWALGVVLFEMITGRRPFSGASAIDLVSAIVHAPVPELPADTPAGLRNIVGRCLRKAPGERYQTASEVAAALETVVTGAVSVRPVRRSLGRGLLGAALLVAAVAGVAGWWMAGRSRTESAIGSLAVLPFDDLSPGERSEYLADGITDAVITELGQLGALRVISRTSSMRFRGSSQSISEIARDLGVDAILEGSLVRDGERVRVTARLIRAGTESSLWTGSYDRELRDILALQRDLARTVAGELRLGLTPDLSAQLARRQTVNPQAVEAYLQGRYQWAKRTPASLRLSIDLFETAIRADPTYAAPHGGLASSYVLLGVQMAADRPSPDALREAKAAAARALALDPRAAEALTALAYAQLWSWDFSESARAFERAIALNPNDATTRFWNAVRLAAEGRFEDSMAEVTLGQRLDPVSPIVTAGVSWMYHLAGRHAEAEEHARRVLQIEPDFVVGIARLGVAQKHRGDYTAALATLQRAIALSERHPDNLAQLGQTLALQGRVEQARQVLDELDAMAKARYVPALDRVLVYAGLGDRDRAFEWLERAYAERYGGLALLAVDPDLASLRDDPRFGEFVRKIGLRPAR